MSLLEDNGHYAICSGEKVWIIDRLEMQEVNFYYAEVSEEIIKRYKTYKVYDKKMRQ